MSALYPYLVVRIYTTVYQREDIACWRVMKIPHFS